jgi:alkyl hydroperoxide reductase subunit AhpF
MLMQATKFGAELQLADVKQVVPWTHASGSHSRKIGIPGEEEFTNKGVFYGATCDGPRFARKVVAVAGGGDSGITEALSRWTVSKVIVIELMPQMMANRTLQERVLSIPKIEAKCGVNIKAILGNNHVELLEITNTETGENAA